MLTLQLFRIVSINISFILKLLVFVSTGQLYNDKYLPQYYCSFLPPGLSYFANSLLSFFYFLHHLVKMQQDNIDAFVNLNY